MTITMTQEEIQYAIKLWKATLQDDITAKMKRKALTAILILEHMLTKEGT